MTSFLASETGVYVTMRVRTKDGTSAWSGAFTFGSLVNC